MSEDTNRRVDAWERHVRTLGNGVALLLMAWMGTTMVTMGKDVAIIKSQLPQLVAVSERVIVLSERVALLENTIYTMQGRK